MNKNIVIEYTERANDIIKRYSNYRNIVKDGVVNIAEVNNCLGDYFAIMTHLITEHERKALELSLLEEAFEDWFGRKYVEVQKSHNKKDLAATKWLSQREIERYVRQDWSGEYQERNNNIKMLKSEVDTLKRLCDAYKKMDNIFMTLSNNQRAEIKSLSLENRMNSEPKERVRAK